MRRPPHNWLRYVAYGMVLSGALGAVTGDEREVTRLLLVAGGLWAGIFAMIDWARRG
jgi:hypothetical protein